MTLASIELNGIHANFQKRRGNPASIAGFVT